MAARNSNEAMVVPVVASGGFVFGESLESGGRPFVCAFGNNLASVAVKIFFI